MLYKNIEDYFKNFNSLPKSDKKKAWNDVFEAMAVHTRKMKPTKLLLARRPNEPTDIAKYRLDNYRPITYASMNKALDDVSRIIAGISYTVTADDRTKDYLNSHVITQYSSELHAEIMNVRSFIEKIVLKRDIEDPNGFLIWMPAGAGLTDSSEKVTPEPKLVLSEEYRYSDDFVFIFEDEERTPLQTDDGKYVSEGEVYYFITKEQIWKNYQVGKKSDPTWEQELIYSHKLGAFPVIVLGGDINADNYYESFFAPYLAYGDEAIHQFSDWQAVNTNSAFPITEVFAREVMMRKEEINKQSNNPQDSEENFSGGEGNGSFKLVPMQPSPYGIIQRTVPNPGYPADILPADIPAIRYINPDVNVLKYLGESWERLIEKAENALNINLTTGLNQSGEAKKIDKESQYAMISKIANNFFDNIYLNSLKCIDGYLNLTPLAKSEVSIAKPSSFYVKSEDELSAEIGNLKSTNAPQFFLAEATLELAKKRFNGNKLSEKIFEVISLYDALYTDTDAEKTNKLASNVITKEDYIHSIRMFSILNQIASEKTSGEFIKMAHADIYSEFLTRVKQFYPAQPTIERDENGLPI